MGSWDPLFLCSCSKKSLCSGTSTRALECQELGALSDKFQSHVSFADNPNALLPLVLFVVLVCLIAAGLVLLLCFRNHRHRLRMRRYLLPNMEVPTINPISDPQMPLPKPFTDQTEGNTCEETAQSQRSERRPMACHSLSVDTLRSEASHALSESPARENVGKKEDTQAEMNVFKSNRPPACSDLQFNESILDQRLPMGFQSEVAF